VSSAKAAFVLIETNFGGLTDTFSRKWRAGASGCEWRSSGAPRVLWWQCAADPRRLLGGASLPDCSSSSTLGMMVQLLQTTSPSAVIKLLTADKCYMVAVCQFSWRK